jgi:hypothetical protein
LFGEATLLQSVSTVHAAQPFETMSQRAAVALVQLANVQVHVLSASHAGAVPVQTPVSEPAQGTHIREPVLHTGVDGRPPQSVVLLHCTQVLSAGLQTSPAAVHSSECTPHSGCRRCMRAWRRGSP